MLLGLFPELLQSQVSPSLTEASGATSEAAEKLVDGRRRRRVRVRRAREGRKARFQVTR